MVVKASERRTADIYIDLLERLPRHVSVDVPALVFTSAAGDTARHYGYYDKTLNVIGLAPDIGDQPETLIRGVLAHELGHALVRLLKLGTARGYDAEERQADSVAEELLGLCIYYGPDGVQRAGKGARGTRPRPAGLR
jgi:Zn-dependent peptidase ImmA (M78 family)